MMRLLQYLRRRGEKRLGAFELRILSSYELLCARAEAGKDEDAGLRFNAGVLARAIRHRGRTVFSSAQQVMEHLSVEQITQLAEEYRDMCREQDLLGASLFEISQVLRPIDRLRYQILHKFGILPTSEQARSMTDGDVLFCAAVLEQVDAVNPNFDVSRFEELR